MLGPPDHLAPPAPMATHEEFHVPDIEAPAVPGYVNMKPKQGTAIYTPSAENGSDLDEIDDETSVSQPLKNKTSPVQKPPRKSKERQMRDVDDEDGPGENIPMLETNRSSRPQNHHSETDYKDLMPRYPRDTIESNQYVNVPSATLTDAVSNPSYVVVNNVNERN